jgi:hypothetical protein
MRLKSCYREALGGLLSGLRDPLYHAALRVPGFGVGAAEIMSSVQIEMISGLPYGTLRDAILTHPTLVEALIPLFSSAASTQNLAEATRTAFVVIDCAHDYKMGFSLQARAPSSC